MPAITRVGDLCTGHGGYPPRAATSGSPDAFCNGKAVVRVGDAYAVHCSSGSCHPGVASSGSPDIFCNGKPVMLIGHAINCGSKVAQGSPDAFGD